MKGKKFKTCAEHPETKGSMDCEECAARLRKLNQKLGGLFGFGTGSAPAKKRGKKG